MKTLKHILVSIVYLCIMDIKNNIFKAAFDLFLKYGIKSVSMDDICRKMAISKKTLYESITNKDELVSEIVERHIATDRLEIQDLLKSSNNALEEMVNISNHIIKFLGRISPSLTYDLKKYHPQTWDKIENNHFHFIHDVIFNNIKKGQKEGNYRKDISPEIISILYIYMTRGITDETYFPQDSFPKVTLYKQLISYHIYGIVTPQGREMLTKLKFD